MRAWCFWSRGGGVQTPSLFDRGGHPPSFLCAPRKLFPPGAKRRKLFLHYIFDLNLPFWHVFPKFFKKKLEVSKIQLFAKIDKNGPEHLKSINISHIPRREVQKKFWPLFRIFEKFGKPVRGHHSWDTQGYAKNFLRIRKDTQNFFYGYARIRIWNFTDTQDTHLLLCLMPKHISHHPPTLQQLMIKSKLWVGKGCITCTDLVKIHLIAQRKKKMRPLRG